MRNELCNWVKPLILKRTGSLRLFRLIPQDKKQLIGGSFYENDILSILLWNIKK